MPRSRPSCYDVHDMTTPNDTPAPENIADTVVERMFADPVFLAELERIVKEAARRAVVKR